jgi:L-ascorbate 6-phosphate lactonase
MRFDIHNIRQNVHLKDHEILIYWLGGYGFVLKFPTGQILCMDPYLSDCVERIAGFRRLSLAPISADQLQSDILTITHDHPDHLDVDSIQDILRQNPNCAVVAGSSCENYLKELKTTPITILKAGQSVSFGEIAIEAIDADHGKLCKDAIGFLIRFRKRSLYFTADTCLNKNVLASAIQSRPEIIIPNINPTFGNLSEIGAASLVALCGSSIAIPGHFWLFAEHGGDPAAFQEQVHRLSPTTKVVLMTPGWGEIL